MAYEIRQLQIANIDQFKAASTMDDDAQVDQLVRRRLQQIYQGQRKDKAVVFIHGFMASTFETEELSKYLNETSGFTVVNPLLAGFGSNYKYANKFATINEWQKSILKTVNIVSKCYKEIAIIGGSLGGALAMDFVFNVDNQFVKIENNAKLSQLVLLSPYVSPAIPGSRRILGTLDTLGIKGVPLATLNLWGLFGDDPDLKELLENKNFYLAKFPIQTGLEVMKLSENLLSLGRDIKSPISVFAALSKHDKIVSFEESRDFLQARFENLKTLIIYDEADDGTSNTVATHVPHHLWQKKRNPDVPNLFKEIAEFIQARSNTTDLRIHSPTNEIHR